MTGLHVEDTPFAGCDLVLIRPPCIFNYRTQVLSDLGRPGHPF